MTYKKHRRHSRWYERLFFNGFFQWILGLSIVLMIPLLFFFDFRMLGDYSYLKLYLYYVVLVFLFYNIIFIVVLKIQVYPGNQTLSYFLATSVIVWAFGLGVSFYINEIYLFKMLAVSFLMSVLWIVTYYFLGRRFRILKIALVPYGRALALLNENKNNAIFQKLSAPDLIDRRYDVVVADFRADDLPPHWERFLARCTLARIPVLHYKKITESLSGRVQIEHLSENEFGALLPSPFYEFAKRSIDLFVVVLFSPLWLSIILLFAVIIKLESSGSVFFVQERVGQSNRSFKLYKLRSMCQNSEENGAQFASANDIRVTKVGRFIRKARVDEIPQFINVLKGDMSLIGPRPEQRPFVEQFEYEIPFYAYRHVVKPGITGWAQVTHGYAADADDTKIKIEHDFYYIKNFSFWLDLLIFFKTVRTVFTGFGAR